MIRTSRIRQVLSAFVLAAVSLTCSGDKLVLPDEGDPSAIVVIDGNNQTGTVGLVLTDSIIVRVTDSKARPVEDARVQFVLGTNATGSDLIPDTAVTDADGRARARWVLGTKSGSQVVTARVVDFTAVATNITATATAEVPDTVFVLSGDGQTGTVGQALAESLVVRVNDQFGNPVNAVAVGWSVSGGGTVSALSVATGPNGQAAVQRVLGSTAGPQSAAATVPGVNGSPVAFNHTAVAGGPTALLKIDGDNQTAPAGTFLAESLEVRLVDGSGNGVAGRSIAFTPGLGNGTASPSPVVTDVNGFASSRWTLGSSAGSQSLTASGAGFSVIFTATATSDVPTQMAINAGNNQSAVAGTAVTIPPSVRVRDVNNNPVANVSVTFTVTAGGGTVSGPSGSGTSTVVATNGSGIAALNSWTLGAAVGSNNMNATASGPGGPLAGSPLLFNATGIAGPPSQITITTQPPGTVASGATFGTAPVVQIRDAGGNPINQANINVTVSLSSGSGTLNGTKTQPTTASGQASFPGLSISGLVGPYTLAFSSGSLTPDTSSTITLTPGPANRLVLTTQPSSSAQSGVAFAQQPVVQIQDAAGNPVSQNNTPVTAAIATGGGTLNGTTTVNTNSSGTAGFLDLAISGAAGGRTLDFTSPGLTKATSTVVTIGAGGATKLGFGVQPTTSTAGSAISPAVTVLVQDASGNTVSGATDAVTIALLNNPSGATLSGTLTVNAVNGVATFPDLSLNKTGTGYTLTATASGLSGATSNGFNITPGSATQLVFTQQPSNVVAGASIAPAVTVTAQDALGNTATSYGTAISLTIGNNPGSGTLTGGGAVTPVSGVATFGGLSINRTGSGYTLVANSGALTKISSAFDVSPGSATQLVFTQQPTNTNTATPISPAVKVAVEDALGNTVTTATTSITVAIGTNPPGNGILSGTKTLNAVAGVATFSTLSIDKPGNGYTLTADGGGLPQEVSAAFDIAVGTGNKLGFVTQPSNAVVGAANSPAIQVEVLDAANNRIVTATNPIRLVIDNDPNGGATTITGGGPINAVNGVASFPNVRLDRAGSGFTLTALSSGLIDTLSTAFNITAAATTTTISSDLPDPSRVGQGVTVVFTVAVVAPGSGTPTGTVTVSDGTDTCQASVASGQCQLFSTTAGAKTITASYPGDGNFTASTSAGTSHQVNAANTTTVIDSVSSATSVVGEPVSVFFTVTVNSPGNGTPTGNVVISSGADTVIVPVSAGQGDIVFTSPGSKTITARYAGDGNFNPSQDTDTHTVNKAGTTTTITSDLPDPSGAGVPITVNFTVIPNAPGAGTPTGNVVVTISGSGDTCTGTVAAGTCQLTISTVGAGKTITATYNGDANFNSDSDTETHDVTAGTTTTAITSTVPSASVVGQQVAIHYSVTPSGGGTPTGTVTVSDGTQSCNASVAAGQCNITFNSAGARILVATYAGDANFSGSTSPGFGHQVNTASTTTSITSDTPDPSSIGQAVTVDFSVTVDAPGGGTPTGNVTVSDGTDTCVGTVAAGTCSITLNTSGSRPLTATYAGDASFNGSSSPAEPHSVGLTGTATSITGHTPNPSVVGQPVAVSVSVTGGSTPTGTVTVSDGATNCVATLSGGTGSCNITLGTAGARTLTGTYSGDGSHGGSTSPGVAQTVNQANTTSAITSDSPDPSSIGQAVTVDFSVTVDAPGGGTPTGNVTVSDGTDTCVGTVAAGTCSITLNTSGSRPLTATYAGDANFNGSASVAEPHAVGLTGTTTAITGHTPDPSVVGQPVAVSVSVTGGSTPTGTVTVSDGATNCVATLSGGTGSCNITLSTAGARTLTGTYSGDGSHGGSTSPGVGQTVNQANTTSAITSDSPDPSVVGNTVTVDFTVTVDAPGSGTPTGNVTVSDGTDTCVGTVAAGSCDITLNTVGSATLTATYAGNSNFSGSTSAGEPHTVTASLTTTSITGHNPTPSTVGDQVTVTFSVTGTGTPTGSVTVSDGSINCNGPLSGGTGSCDLTFTTAGSRTLTASYGGDGTHAPSTSAGTTHLVNKANTTTAITSDIPDPSAVLGTVTVSYTVTSTGGTPTGNVTVSDGVTSCTATVAAGSCDITLTVLGARTLTAEYLGDANFNGSTSPGEPHDVSLTGTSTDIDSHIPDPSVAGQAVAVQFTVTSNSGDPPGSVTVSDGTSNCTGTLSGGSGSCNLTLVSAGVKSLIATYPGGVSYSGSVSSSVAHQVNPANTTTTITSDSPDPSSIGQAVAVDFSVTVDAPGSGTPTGNVTVSDGVDNCTGTVAAGTCNITLTTSGSRPLTAVYAGDADFNGSTAATEPHTVTLVPTTTTIVSHTPSPSVVGQPVDVSFTVTGGLTPTGTVTVGDGVESCQGTLNGGAGTCALTLTTGGGHTLVATYGGDGSHGGSTSAGVSHTVNPAQTKVTVVGDSPDPSVVGQAVAIDYTVVVTGAGSGTPTGNVVVTVDDGSGDTCTGSVAAGTCNLILTTPGNGKTLTATYAGNSDYQPDTHTAKHNVNAFGPVDPGSSTAVVPDGQSGQPTSITIQARDQFGNAVTVGGETVSVTISGLNSDTAVVTDNNDGTYTAVYTPASGGGVDTIDITINGTPIQGSPFSSTIP